MNELVLTPAALLDILQQIDELGEYPVSINETSSKLQLKVGDSIYNISTSNAEPVEVSDDAVEAIKDINETTYDELDESAETVEGGLLKELTKTLLVGGMVRLTTKLLGGNKK